MANQRENLLRTDSEPKKTKTESGSKLTQKGNFEGRGRQKTSYIYVYDIYYTYIHVIYDI